MSKAKEQPKEAISRRTKGKATAPPIETTVRGSARHVESGASEPAAEEAEHALEGSEADELRKAESAAKDGRKA